MLFRLRRAKLKVLNAHSSTNDKSNTSSTTNSRSASPVQVTLSFLQSAWMYILHGIHWYGRGGGGIMWGMPKLKNTYNIFAAVKK